MVVTQDPRFDLLEDSVCWQKILTRASLYGENVLMVLHGFRCCGAKLRKVANGYRLEPRLGPNHGWQTQEDWDTDRTKYLLPIAEALTEILFNDAPEFSRRLAV